MDVSIMIEGQMGLNWERWGKIARAVEELGFAGLYRSDHFVNPHPPDQDSLEMITSLTYLVTATTRIRFGPLVAPVSFRDPVMLARQAAAIASLSAGRLVLTLGMGWNEREHEMFGYELGDVPTRIARLGEALEIISRLLRDDGPVTFEGRFYRVMDAAIAPRAPVPLGVGGNGIKATLPLAARHADVWNGFYLPPDDFRARSETLDVLMAKEGRSPSDMRRTLMTGVLQDVKGDDAAKAGAGGAIAGSTEDMRAQLEDLESAGCDEVMLQWFALDDLDGLGGLARALLH